MKKIYISPNRPNIYLFNKKISKDMVEGFSWITDDIKENNINTEKTLVYCKTQKDCGKLFRTVYSSWSLAHLLTVSQQQSIKVKTW